MLCYGLGMRPARVPLNQLTRVKRNRDALGAAAETQDADRGCSAGTLLRKALATFQQGFYSHYRIVDFYLPDHNPIIEIDGRYYDAASDREARRVFTSAS